MDEKRAPLRGDSKGLMSRVVVGTMFFTAFAGLIWHETAMFGVNRAEKSAILNMEHDLRELGEYKAAHVRGGINEATRYLLASTTKQYEF